MFSLTIGFAILFCYAALVFSIAMWVERKAAAGKNIGDNSIIYTCSLVVWMTAWSYYGQVGRAAKSGVLYLTAHLAATLFIFLFWIVLRKMVRIRHTHRVTSIADLISLRYNKSQAIAALATVIAIVGIVPYLTLQLKAVISSFSLIIRSPDAGTSSWGTDYIGLIFVAFMILFTIIFGVRRLVPTERHQGMVVAMAAESWVKLLSFAAVGIFVTYFLFDGFGDIFNQFAASSIGRSPAVRQSEMTIFPWITNLAMAGSAFMLVPAMFHIMVVENFHEKHIRTAMWLFPLLLLIINIFVLPVAMAGLLKGYGLPKADSFVLLLPFDSGHSWLSGFAFLGGFSSAMGFLVVNLMTLSTMFTNHLLLPLIESSNRFVFLKRYVLQCRWVAVAVLILASYWFERQVGQYSMLSDLGLIAFVALLQLAPALFGGLFWKKGNLIGALLGMVAGFLVWLYSLILPAFAKAGWLGQSFFDHGPLGISLLRPEHLFGVTGLDPASHALLWTMLSNVTFYVLASLSFEQSQDERNIAEKIVDMLTEETPQKRLVSGAATIDREGKKKKIESLFDQYFSATNAARTAEQCLNSLGFDGRDRISVVELMELRDQVEKTLASCIGAATAHHAIRKAAIFTPAEEDDLRRAFAGIMTELGMPVSALVDRIDYFRERGKLLSAQAAEMEETIKERDREIAERKLAQEALAEEKERLAVTLRSIGDGVITTDIDGRVLLINNVAEQLTGWRQHDAIGRPLTEVFAIIDRHNRQACENPVHNVLRSGSTIGLAEHTLLVSRDGTERLVADSGAPIRDSESGIIGVVLVFRDITEQERMEEELLRTQKLENVGVLAGGIAHDFNNILTAIIGNISMAKFAATAGDRIRERLEAAEAASLRAKDLTQQLLTFSRGGAPIKKIASIVDIISESARFTLRGAKVKCEFALDDDLRLAEVDGGQISQVINNIIINANQAMPEGGVIRVAAENLVLDDPGRLPLAPGNYLKISIEDSGTGIQPEQINNIFDPYFTTKEEGNGLGLATSYSIIKKHDGHITVESMIGEGTKFFIYLPASEQGTVSIENRENPVRLGSGRVLLMDDEEIVRQVSGQMLALLGYEVEFARDGRETLSLYDNARKNAHPFDVVIMDLTIPGGMGGRETMKQLLALDPQVRAIVSSGYSTDPVMAEFKAHGFCCVVVKPYKIEELSAALQEVFRNGDQP